MVHYFAMIDNYPLTGKNFRFDLLILHWHLWGRRFQRLKIEGGQKAGGNGRDFSGGKSSLSSEQVEFSRS
jgi:hypothetical protein